MFGNLTGTVLEKALADKILILSEHSLKVQLRNVGITELKGSIFETFSDLKVLDFQDNVITEIEDGIFSRNTALEKIDLMANYLRKVKFFQPGDFPALEEINLSRNLIEFIEPGSFDKMPQLETIELSQNCLRLLTPDLFKKNPSLRTFFAGSNELENIAYNIFNSKTELKILNISANNLSFVPELELTKVQHFVLSHNKITLLDLNYDTREKKKSADVVELVLTFNQISDCVELEERRTDIMHLDLSHNVLTDLHDFPSFLNLEVLILAFNNIGDLSLHDFEEKFPSLKVLNLRENPVECSDYRYIKNNLQSIILNVDSANVHRCQANKTLTNDDEYSDYEDLMAKEFRTIGRNLMKQLVYNYSLLLALLVILVVCLIILTINQVLAWKSTLNTKESLIDQMEFNEH